ncbi:hypothetical protein [Methylobacterium sp. Gmos1]
MRVSDDGGMPLDDGAVRGRGSRHEPIALPGSTRQSRRLADRLAAKSGFGTSRRTELARRLKEAIERLRAVNARVERTGRVARSGPALIRLVGVIERAEAVLARGAGDDLVDAAIVALGRALDGATAEFSASHDLPQRHAQFER